MSLTPSALGQYLQQQDERRAHEAAQMFAELNEREQKLVREAAVLGFVNGAWAAGGIDRERFPKDSKILQDVLLAAQSHSDLHPTLGGLLDPDEDPEEGS